MGRKPRALESRSKMQGLRAYLGATERAGVTPFGPSLVLGLTLVRTNGHRTNTARAAWSGVAYAGCRAGEGSTVLILVGLTPALRIRKCLSGVSINDVAVLACYDKAWRGGVQKSARML